MEDLDRLFNPKSIAIVGASTDPKSVGHLLVKNLQEDGFLGKLFPVNPKTDTLLGLPCFARLTDIHEPLDLVIIAVPAKIVPAILEDVGSLGIKNAIIISAGFKETGDQGLKLEQEVISLSQKFHINILGPNCLGFLKPQHTLNASFAKGLPQTGPITFLSQSGALLTTLLDETRDTLGYSHFVSIGNKAVLSELELIEYFLKDSETKLLAFYTESLSGSDRLRALGKQALDKTVPLIALKSGTTDAGAHASSSHTGALAGTDEAYRALFHQARITQAHSLAHLVELLEVFSKNPLPLNNRVAIVTNAGGLGVLATDCAVQAGLELAQLSEKTKKRLSLALPPSAAFNNPVDVIGDALADRYEQTLRCVAEDPSVDMLLVIVTPQAMTEGEATARVIAQVKKTSEKPLVAVVAEGPMLAAARALLHEKGVATLSYPENAARALGNMAHVERWRAVDTSTPFVSRTKDIRAAKKILSRVIKENREYFSQKEAQEFLECYSIRFPKTALVTSAFEATRAAKAFPHAVALKIESPDILHKSDVGGVLLGIEPHDLGKNYERLLEEVHRKAPKATLVGALISEMAPAGGQELLLGLKQEPGLGTAVVIALGGIFVEVFHDSSMRFAPLAYHDTQEMLEELKSFPLLLGARGGGAIHLETLKQYLKALSDIAEDFPEITELDINPLLAFPKAEDFIALDARIRITLPETVTDTEL